jgi:dienelactone hydrolase
MVFTTKRITFLSDGLRLTGFLSLPDGISHPPGILFLHGAGLSTMVRFTQWQEFLAEKGIASFAFDYRGCGESQGTFEDSSLNNRLSDADKALQTFLLSGVDIKNLSVSGASMSGHVSIRLIEKFPWVKAIILQCAAAYSAEAEDKPLNQAFTREISKPNSWADSPVFEILEKYQGKVYTFYGEHDQVIPQAVQDRFNKIATKKGQAIRLAHATHTILQPKNDFQAKAMKRMFELSYEFLAVV